MKVVLYILCFCFLLLGGYCAAYGILPNDSGKPAIKRIGKTQLVKIPVIEKDPVISHSGLPLNTKQTIVTVETEDDSDSHRKYSLLATCLILVSFASFLNYLFKYFKNQLNGHKKLLTVSSYKYLLQGVLRI